MSQAELQRVKVIENAVRGRMTVQEASRLLGISGRQVKRLKARYQAETVDWVKHGNRGGQPRKPKRIWTTSGAIPGRRQHR